MAIGISSVTDLAAADMQPQEAFCINSYKLATGTSSDELPLTATTISVNDVATDVGKWVYVNLTVDLLL